MLSQEEVLFYILRAFDELDIAYLIVGSYASNYWGRPRATHDADILLIWQPKNIDEFVKKLGPDFFADADDLKEALHQKRISNIIHPKTGFKVDLSPLGNSAYDQEMLSRRKAGMFSGQKAFFASAEDVILTKLLWVKMSGSLRQLEDAKGILQVQANSLDKNYLKRWATTLSVSQLLESIL